MLGRIVGTALAVLGYGVIMMIYNPAATLITGQVAGRQFENSDSAYVTAISTINFFSAMSVLLGLALFVVLVLIWFKPVRTAIQHAIEESKTLVAIIAVGGTLLLGATNANAFFEKTDRTEAYPILPNQSAFWIPDVGANKDSQSQFTSTEYQNAQKVEFKRFTIPHQKLQNSAGTGFFSGWDYYVPTGRLIIVDRTPFARDWQAKSDKGTSNRNEAMACQTKEGLDWSVGLSIGVSVRDEDAFRFLNSFGIVAPQGQIKGTSDAIDNDGKILFQSVYYSRTVEDVMDNVAHREIHTLVCRQVMGRSLDEANGEMNKMMDQIEKDTKAYLANYGVTLSFIGWADTVTFEDKVQDAINRRYIAAQDQAIATALQPYADVLQKLAAAKALAAFGDKSDGKLPTTIVGLPPEVGGLLSTLLKSGPAAPAAPTR